MNKKFFLGMLAAAGMLFSTSCMKDEPEVVQTENDAQVTFSLGLEGGISTRAISDGKSADVLVYAVFDKDGNRISTIPAVTRTGVTFPTTENITLAKGQTYMVAFWAQDEDCKAYTLDTDEMSVTIDYANNENKVNNDETRDAFFKTVEFTVTGSTSINVEMKRPFAQINVGVTKEDWDAAVASGIEIEKSSVVIKNAATSLNLLDGTVGNETVEVSYALNTIPNEKLNVDTDGDGLKEEYNWLSMSYILPAEATTGYAKTTLENVAFVFSPKNTAYSNIEFNQGLNSVPVQRNWRTNILGKLLTGDITFNIVIDEEFEDDYNVMVPYATINGVAYPSFADAMAAVQDGETIKLEGETTLNGVANSKLFTVNENITIDLNGYGFVANMPDVTANSSIFEVGNGGELTIIGEGNVKFITKAAPANVAAFINNIGGTVNLKGGNWTLTETGDYALIPTFVDNNSNTSNVTLNIYGGTYTFTRCLFRNFANAAGHNNYATVATMNIYGGTFNGLESDGGVIWNQKPSSDVNVPATAGVINVMGGTFNNVNIDDEFKSADSYLTVTTADELTQVIKDATADVTIFLANDITGNATAEQKEGVNVVVNGNGHKYDGTITLDGNARHTGAETLTFANINFEHADGSIYFIECNVGGGYDAYAHNVTVKDCTFKGNSNGDVVGMRYRQCYNMNVINCTATDVHSLMWTTGGENITVDGVNVITAKEGGISTATTKNVTVKNSNITVPTAYGYGIRINSSDDNTDLNLNVENNTITADAPILLRQAKAKTYTINLTGNNNLLTSKLYHIITTAGEYKDGVALTEPTGTVNVNGAANYNVYPMAPNAPMYANSTKQLKNVIEAGATIVNLTAGEFEADIYNITARESLTITGTEGTKIAFSKAQFRPSEFSEVVIRGCEILRMPDKSWGHLVFGSSGKATGVYTIEDCTFNGVGTQGIYINENVSGATYNILNCTFNGDFGSEGAVTIQCNETVNHNVNVTGCTFNNLPATSNKIFVIYQNTDQTAWNLVTDVPSSEINSVVRYW